MPGISGDPDRFDAARRKHFEEQFNVVRRNHFEEKLRQKSKEKELNKKSKKKKKARSPASVVPCGALELVVKETRFPEKKASKGVRGKGSASKPVRRLTQDSDGVRSKGGASKPIRRLTQELLLPFLRRRVTPAFAGDCVAGLGAWECAHCTYLNGVAGPELDAAACAVCRKPRGPPGSPGVADLARAEVAGVSRENSISSNRRPDDSGFDPVSWGDLKKVLERVRRDSLLEGWGNLDEQLKQVESSEYPRDQANGESLDESWNNLSDALEQAKRESLRLFQSYDGILPEV